MATRSFKQIVNLGRTRAGYKKIINKVFESSLPNETIEECEELLSLAKLTRGELLNEVIELSNRLDNSTNPSQESYVLLENLQRLVNEIDKKVIPSLNRTIHDLSRLKAKDAQKVNVVKSSNYKDKKYGFPAKHVPNKKEYKRDRGIARTNKKKRQWLAS